MKIAGYTIHPAAAAMPPMPDDEFASLKADIEAHGLVYPVELYKGKLIDGRHRARACEELGVAIEEVDAGDLKGMTPTEYVVSLNFARRHLTASQKAAIADDLLPPYEAEAKERQREHGGTAPGRAKDTCGTNATSVSEPPKSRDQVAKIVGVSPRLVSDAKAIRKADPELFEAVKRGEKTVAQAKRELPKPEAEKPAKRPAKNGAEKIRAQDRQRAFNAFGALSRAIDDLKVRPKCDAALSTIHGVLERV